MVRSDLSPITSSLTPWSALPSRFPDLLGDKADWITHVEELYDDLFLPFIARAGDIDVVPIGIEKVDDTIFYAHDTGFERKQPEFHGHVSHGVALVPMFCPFCVYNDYIPIMARMKQYVL